MSDFLTHLAARTIAQPALRPRTQSRFEPASREEAPLVWPVTAKSAPPPPEEQESRVNNVGRVLQPAPPVAGQRTRATSEVVAPREPTPEPRVVTVPRVSTRVVREVEHDVERVVETNERVVTVPQRIESEPRTVIKTISRPHRFEHEPPRVIRERRPGDAVHHEREIRTTLDRPPRLIRDRAEAPGAAASRAEPVIEVSIGRIEVRAVSSGTQQRQPPSRSSAMTIDDYVAKRKAKERR